MALHYIEEAPGRSHKRCGPPHFLYTLFMRSVADDLREDLARQVREMTADERVALAFRLGDEDLEAFRQAHGLTREEAYRRLKLQRQQGRQYSRCMIESLK